MSWLSPAILSGGCVLVLAISCQTLEAFLAGVFCSSLLLVGQSKAFWRVCFVLLYYLSGSQELSGGRVLFFSITCQAVKNFLAGVFCSSLLLVFFF